MKQLLAIGCTGLIGQRLVPALVDAGYAVRALSRDPQRAQQKLPQHAALTFAQWDGLTDALDSTLTDACDAIINLAGVGIADERWSAARKQALHDSRILPTRTAAQAAAHNQIPLINASAIGWYGWPNEPVDESAPAGDTYLATLTAAWEEALAPARQAGVRTVALRIGAVLDPQGGALGEMVRPWLPLGSLGHGRQIFNWVHVDDVVGMITQALRDPQWEGPVNAVAPAQDTLWQFMQALREVTGKILMPIGAPGWVLRLALGEMADMLLNGAVIVPQRAQNFGYQWRYGDVNSALQACYPRNQG